MAIFHTETECESQPRRSLTGARWLVTPPAEALPGQARAGEDNLSAVLRQVLAARGVVTPEEMNVFLNAELASLPDPLLMPDMAAAVEAVQDTLARGARIRIFGDYDADGITSTALLVRALNAIGGANTVDWYLPHRIDDGYGLNTHSLDEARADGVELGITVDNGISAHEQLAHAERIGLRMIVTDHHEPGSSLPPAIAVINPKRADCVYPYRELAGVGVAFTLLRALCRARNLPPVAPMKFLDLVTIGTIADVAPLTGENRILVRHGLPLLTPMSKKVGIAALLRAIGIPERASCSDVAYQIGPRLNAAGRVAHAEAALRLLLTGDRAEAEALAAQLCEHNTDRQEEEKRTLEQALTQVERVDMTQTRVLVLASGDWHPGVIGIVASRLVERYHRPCALISVQEGIGKGSARARAPFHLWEALSNCAHLLRRFGGHRVAAGFELDATQIPALQEALAAEGARMLTDDDLLPAVEIDAWLDLGEVTTGFARQAEMLAPFGMGNPTPVFAVTDAQVVQCIRRGQDGAHLSLTLRADPGARPVPAIWFRHGECYNQLRTGDRVDVAFTVGLNTYLGTTSAQMVVKDVRV